MIGPNAAGKVCFVRCILHCWEDVGVEGIINTQMGLETHVSPTTVCSREGVGLVACSFRAISSKSSGRPRTGGGVRIVLCTYLFIRNLARLWRKCSSHEILSRARKICCRKKKFVVANKKFVVANKKFVVGIKKFVVGIKKFVVGIKKFVVAYFARPGGVLSTQNKPAHKK